jgi:hypothetical protein
MQGINHYARQHLKVANDRMLARYPLDSKKKTVWLYDPARIKAMSKLLSFSEGPDQQCSLQGLASSHEEDGGGSVSRSYLQ